MNRAPRELIDDLRDALIAEHKARQALREASHRSVEVMVKLRDPAGLKLTHLRLPEDGGASASRATSSGNSAYQE